VNLPFYQQINNWFDLHGRNNLPWQQTNFLSNQNFNNSFTNSAYHVWISEIMLQQTQVQTVIPYFNRWITRFPNIASIANSSLEEVMTYWQGLGYYARVRNIHTTAQYLHHHPIYQGTFPTELSEVEKLKGIGPSTARAILASSDGQVLSLIHI
jgi:A/G-specific adenine glycosylase